jgi:hypothetical protein
MTVSVNDVGLNHVSSCLMRDAPARGICLPINAMVVGGPISVLRFGIRTATEDVDFYVADPDSNDLLEVAEDETVHTLGWNGQEGWFTLVVGTFIEADLAFENVYANCFFRMTLSMNLLHYDSSPLLGPVSILSQLR